MNTEQKTVAVSGSSGLIGSALVTPRRRRPRVCASCEGRRGPVRSAGIRAPGAASRPPSTASTPSSTWLAPGSATIGGPRPTSADPREPDHGTRPPRRDARPLNGPRPCSCRAPQSDSTAIGATSSSTRRAAPGSGFLADFAGSGRRPPRPAEAAGVRVAHLRTGIVLAKEGGALPRCCRCSSWARRSLRVGPPVDELDQHRRRGRGDRPPADERPRRPGQPHRAEPVTNAEFADARPACCAVPTCR